MSRFASEFSEDLKVKLKRLKRKNHGLFEAAIKKIREIEKYPENYKQLRYEMSGYRRVHVMKSFVLIFRVEKKTGKITFQDFDHHDKIYRR